MPKYHNRTQAMHSAAFNYAKHRAHHYLDNSRKLNRLLQQALLKAKPHQQGPLSQVWADLMRTSRLLSAYASGRYRNTPWQSLVLLVASVLYLVMPLDLVPDFIPGLGYLDDAALFTWALSSVKADLENFTAWELENQKQPDQNLDKNQLL